MRDLLKVPEIMEAIQVIRNFEEDKYSDIPHWDGWVENWTDKAVLLNMNIPPPKVKKDTYWFPYSQLRKAADDGSIYASIWILNRLGL